MSSAQRNAAGVVAIVLIVIYSWIMMASSGEAANWAWLILAGAFILLAAVARSMSASRAEDHESD